MPNTKIAKFSKKEISEQHTRWRRTAWCLTPVKNHQAIHRNSFLLLNLQSKKAKSRSGTAPVTGQSILSLMGCMMGK